MPWGDTVSSYDILIECYLAKFGRMYIDYFVEEFRDENTISDEELKMNNSSEEKRDGHYAEGCRTIMANAEHGAYWLAFLGEDVGDNADGTRNIDVRLSADEEYYVQYFVGLMRGDEDEVADTGASDQSLEDTESDFSRDAANYGLSPVQESRIHLETLTGLKLSVR